MAGFISEISQLLSIRLALGSFSISLGGLIVGYLLVQGAIYLLGGVSSTGGNDGSFNDRAMDDYFNADSNYDTAGHRIDWDKKYGRDKAADAFDYENWVDDIPF